MVEEEVYKKPYKRFCGRTKIQILSLQTKVFRIALYIISLRVYIKGIPKSRVKLACTSQAKTM